jgi:ubiquinone biosynthesis protein Coq4
MPQGSLGRVFAEHCQARALNPNLVYIEPRTEVDWMLHHLFGTHDIWHVVTGWGNDDTGEVGLGGFYLAQLQAPFFAFLFALILLNTVFLAPHTLRTRMDALIAGYRSGQHAEPLFGADWEALWATPLAELRQRFGVANSEIFGEGIRAAA